MSRSVSPNNQAITDIRDAILSGDRREETYSDLSLPDTFTAACLHDEDASAISRLPVDQRDPRSTVHIDQVPLPTIAHDEVLVAVMASAVNYNTVWSSLVEPVSTFAFLHRYGATDKRGRRHDLPYQIIGSDLSGIVVRVGDSVTRWRPGQEVVAHCLDVGLESPDGHSDTMLDRDQRIWGYETNFGGFAELSVVRANQLMPKPTHLTWEESASSGLVNSTAYRQLISRNGADIKVGDRVLIWGAAGGLGSYATQLTLAAGAIPVCVVSSSHKAEICREMGAELIIDRNAEGYRFWNNGEQDPREWRRFGEHVRTLTHGHDPDVVFEHPGRDTFGASVYVARRGGTVVTCASTSGHLHEFDNRYLWMRLKRIIGSHFANYREAWEANDLIRRGIIHPALSAVHPLTAAGQALDDVRQNRHIGKVGLLVLSPAADLGVSDSETRERHLTALHRFRERSPHH